MNYYYYYHSVSLHFRDTCSERSLCLRMSTYLHVCVLCYIYNSHLFPSSVSHCYHEDSVRVLTAETAHSGRRGGHGGNLLIIGQNFGGQKWWY